MIPRGTTPQELELFNFVLENGTRATPSYTKRGKRRYKTRGREVIKATVWFLDQFDARNLRRAFRSRRKWNPDGPMDLVWLVGRMRQMACSKAPLAQRIGLELLRNMQQLGAMAHPDVQEAFVETAEAPAVSVAGEAGPLVAESSSEEDFLEGPGDERGDNGEKAEDNGQGGAPEVV